MPDNQLLEKRKEKRAVNQKNFLFTLHSSLFTPQKGFSQIILPLFLLAAIGISVFLVQQKTNLIPFAQQANGGIPAEPPPGCMKISIDVSTRYVTYRNCINEPAYVDDKDFLRLYPGDLDNCAVVGQGNVRSDREDDATDTYKIPGTNIEARTAELKDVIYNYQGNWKDITRKGPRIQCSNGSIGTCQDTKVVKDGDRITIEDTELKGPSGKTYKASKGDRKQLTGSPTNATPLLGTTMEVYKSDGGVAVGITKWERGINRQGVADQYTVNESYGFVPKVEDGKTDCSKTDGKAGGGGGNGGDGDKKGLGESCTVKPAGEGGGNNCKSTICTGGKCAQGVDKGGTDCTYADQCQSNTCTNGKCAGGRSSTGMSCTKDSDCATNKCTGGTCAALTSNTTGNGTTNNTTNNTTGNKTTNNTTSGGTNNTTGTTNNTTGGTTAPPVTLTKAEITGFKTSFDALYARLGAAKDTGNLKIVSTIANNELTSIVSQLPTCPDDANVGTCIDSKFRKGFDFAKTAARLSAFYGVFNNIPGICVKSDIGLNPLISATSQTGVTGRVNLCTDRLVATKIWMVFLAGKFTPLLSTDTRFPANPTCASLPADVLSHYQNAESLFKTQPGFIQNTLCDGKTTVAPGGGI